MQEIWKNIKRNKYGNVGEKCYIKNILIKDLSINLRITHKKYTSCCDADLWQPSASGTGKTGSCVSTGDPTML